MATKFRKLLPHLETVESFIAKHGERYAPYLRHLTERPRLVTGFIAWGLEDAWRWSGPWGENLVLLRVTDGRTDKGLRKILTEAETAVQDRHFLVHSIYHFPHRFSKQLDALVREESRSEALRGYLAGTEVEEILSLMTPEERLVREEAIERSYKHMQSEAIGFATVERPIRVHLLGNDDASWSFTYPDTEITENALLALVKDPTFDHLDKVGYVFTN